MRGAFLKKSTAILEARMKKKVKKDDLSQSQSAKDISNLMMGGLNLSDETKQSDVFQQLWKGIAQLQVESGDSIQQVQEKEKELNDAKAKVKEMNAKWEEMKQREGKLIKQVSVLQKDAVVERSNNKALKEQVQAHKKMAESFINDIEEAKLKTGKSLKIALKEKDEVIRVLEETQMRLEAAHSDKNSMRAMLDTYTRRLEESDNMVDGEQNKLKESIVMLKVQIARQQEEAEITGQHLASLAGENKSIKSSYEKMRLLNEKLEESAAVAREEIRESKNAEKAVESKMHDVNEALLMRIKNSEVKYAERESILTKERQQFVDTAFELKRELEEMSARKLTLEQSNTESAQKMKEQNTEYGEKLENMRNAMRQVQDKHLQDIIRFDEEKKSMESRLKGEEEKLQSANRKIGLHEEEMQQLSNIASNSRHLVEKQVRKVSESLENEYNGKIAEIMANHLSLTNNLNGQIMQVKSSTRKELREAQDYKNTFLKAAKEERIRMTGEIETITKQLEEARAKITSLIDEKSEVEKTLKSKEKEFKVRLEEWQILEDDLQRNIVTTQHQISSYESIHGKETEKLRNEISKITTRNKQVEEEKRALIMDCKGLNEQLFQNATMNTESQIRTSEAENEIAKLKLEIGRLRDEAKRFDFEADERIASLQLEIEQQTIGQHDASEKCQELRKELKKAQKRASEQVPAFSEQDKLLQQQLSNSQTALEEKETHIQEMIKTEKQFEKELESSRRVVADLNDKHALEVRDLVSQLEATESASANYKTKCKTFAQLLKDRDSEMEDLNKKFKHTRDQLQRQMQMLKDSEVSKIQVQEQIAGELEKASLYQSEVVKRKSEVSELSSALSASYAEKVSLDHTLKIQQATHSKQLEHLQELFQKSQSECASNTLLVQQLQGKLDSLERHASEKNQKVAEQMNDIELQHGELLKTLHEQLCTKEETISSMSRDHRNAMRELMEEISIAKEQEMKFKSNLIAVKQQAVQHKEKLEQNTVEMKDMKSDQLSLNQVIQSLEKRLTTSDCFRTALEAELNEEKEQHAEVRNKFHQLDSEYRVELKRKTEEIEKVQKQLEAIHDERDWSENDTNIKLAAATRNLHTLEDQLLQKGNEISALEIRIENMMELRNDESKPETTSDVADELKNAHDTANEAAALCSHMEQERETFLSKISDLSTELEGRIAALVDVEKNHEKLVRSYKAVVADKRKLEIDYKNLAFEKSIGNQQVELQKMDSMLDQAEKEGFMSATLEFQTKLKRMENDYEARISKLKAMLEKLKDSSDTVTNDYANNLPSKHSVQDMEQFLQRRRDKLEEFPTSEKFQGRMKKGTAENNIKLPRVQY